MPTKKKRVSMVLPPELEKALYDMRKTEPYNRMSIAEIARTFFEKGLRAVEADTNKTA